MRIIGNLLWLVFGGFETALGYFAGSLPLAVTIIGLPFAWQTFKLGLLALWPFGATVRRDPSSTGCLSFIFNVIWLLTGGIITCLLHLFFGLLLSLTVIGLPWGRQHFKMSGFALSPFGRDISWEN